MREYSYLGTKVGLANTDGIVLVNKGANLIPNIINIPI